MSATPSPYAIDVSTADFKEKVFDASMTVPVVVDFWAEWCGPCKVLKPVLEKLAAEYKGRFILAKVDSDASPELAGHFGVRSIPTVVAIVGGQIVDGFTGAKPEGQIREFLDRFVPPENETGGDVDGLLEQAATARSEGRNNDARQLLEYALAAAPERHEARIMLAEICVDEGDLDSAESLLTQISNQEGEADPRVSALLARIQLVRRNAGADLAGMQARIDAEPDNHQLRLDYANALAGVQDWRGALEQLLASVKQDKSWNEGAARKAMIEFFNLLGSDETHQPLVREFRSKLAATLN